MGLVETAKQAKISFPPPLPSKLLLSLVTPRQDALQSKVEICSNILGGKCN